MIKEALQYIIGLSQPRTEEIYGELNNYLMGTPWGLPVSGRCKRLKITQ